MANTNSYGLGRQIGRLVKSTPWWGWLIFGLIIANFLHSIYLSPLKEASESDVSISSQVVDEKKSCMLKIEQQQQTYNDLLSKKQSWEAAAAIRTCAGILAAEKPELTKMLADAEIKTYLSTIENKKAPSERAEAMQLLLSDYPEVGVKYEKEMNLILASEKRKAELAEKKLKKSQGVKIGMTPDDVRTSSWGKPRDVNRTTSTRGIREQWVYDGGYLYFENDILTTIQN